MADGAKSAADGAAQLNDGAKSAGGCLPDEDCSVKFIYKTDSIGE